MEKKAVMFGAGNVGRGFLGQLFHESGYEVVFVDIDEELVAALNRQGRYTIRLVTNESAEEVVIDQVRAVHGRDREAVFSEMVDAVLMATAVGVPALPHIAPAIALGVARRAEAGVEEPLNIIVCENLKDASQVFRGMVRENLPEKYHRFLAEKIGFVDTVIARMAPLIPPEVRAQDPTLVIVEPYKVLPVSKEGFIGPVPQIVGMEAHSNFAAYVDRKLYIHNAAHAMQAYLGYRKGLEYGYQAMEDPDIYPLVLKAMEESAMALVSRYKLDPAALKEHISDLDFRFRNRALGDTIFRLGRDPIRKLGPKDRLVGAANLALEEGVEPEALAWGIAAGLAFDDERDPKALELQKKLAENGLDTALAEVCGLDPKGHLAQMVKERYQKLIPKDGILKRP